MKMLCIKRYVDRLTFKTIEKGMIVDVDEKRAEELENAGVAVPKTKKAAAEHLAEAGESEQ